MLFREAVWEFPEVGKITMAVDDFSDVPEIEKDVIQRHKDILKHILIFFKKLGLMHPRHVDEDRFYMLHVDNREVYEKSKVLWVTVSKEKVALLQADDSAPGIEGLEKMINDAIMEWKRQWEYFIVNKVKLEFYKISRKGWRVYFVSLI